MMKVFLLALLVSVGVSSVYCRSRFANIAPGVGDENQGETNSVLNGRGIENYHEDENVNYLEKKNEEARLAEIEAAIEAKLKDYAKGLGAEEENQEETSSKLDRQIENYEADENAKYLEEKNEEARLVEIEDALKTKLTDYEKDIALSAEEENREETRSELDGQIEKYNEDENFNYLEEKDEQARLAVIDDYLQAQDDDAKLAAIEAKLTDYEKEVIQGILASVNAQKGGYREDPGYENCEPNCKVRCWIGECDCKKKDNCCCRCTLFWGRPQCD